MANFTHNLAIIIGINQYQNGIAELNTAKPDAQTLAEILKISMTKRMFEKSPSMAESRIFSSHLTLFKHLLSGK
jgi:hypothetical protein